MQARGKKQNFTVGKEGNSLAVMIGTDIYGNHHQYYSFDGRFHEFSKKPRYWDNSRNFTLDNALFYLKCHFLNHWADKQWRSVFIRTNHYPGIKLSVRDLNKNVWIDNPTEQPAPPQYLAAHKKPEYFIFKLWHPMYNAPAINFYNRWGLDTDTGEFDPYKAILCIIGQFKEFALTTQTRYPAYGKVYGDGKTLYTEGDMPKSTLYFDANLKTIFYNSTKRKPQILLDAELYYDF